MTKLDKLMILVMEELENNGFYYKRPNKLTLKLDLHGTSIYIRYSNAIDCFIVNDENQEFNDAVLCSCNYKNERSRLIATGAIINTFNRINNILAERYLESAHAEIQSHSETPGTENVSRETPDTENVSRETSETGNVSRETSHTADTGNYTLESSITPIITPKFTDEEINNELSKVEMRLEDLLYKELKTYTFKYKQYNRYHSAQIVVAFMLDDKMFSINFVTKPNSLDGNVTVTDVFTDEILHERKWLCFNIDNYHRSICSIFYHIVRTIKRNDSLDGYRKINL